MAIRCKVIVDKIRAVLDPSHNPTRGLWHRPSMDCGRDLLWAVSASGYITDAADKHDLSLSSQEQRFISPALVMATLMHIPSEIRSLVYEFLFGTNFTALLVTINDNSCFPTLLPELDPASAIHRSSQVLRVCRTIYLEALPILYDETRFHISQRTFAARIPCEYGNTGGFATNARRVNWTMNCDILLALHDDQLPRSKEGFDRLRELRLEFRIDKSHQTHEALDALIKTSRNSLQKFSVWFESLCLGAVDKKISIQAHGATINIALNLKRIRALCQV